MTSILGDLSPDQFLREYWQKRPCLMRQALAGFKPLLDSDDLAGLACEELAESRLITGRFPHHDWQLRHGPFDQEVFSGLGESNWTLLVQDVEKHYPPLQDLLAQFNFLPTWRLDDLMVSYAAQGGSVGPHVDQYDVFLYQAQGQRLWQIAEQFEPALLEDCPLNVLREFEPEQEWILKPGDMLYLPPNVAHHGVALDEGMTWSIGLRAPSAADLLMALGEQLALAPDGGPRYTDPELHAPTRVGEIDSQAIDRLGDVLADPLRDKDAFGHFLGTFITRFRLANEPVAPGPVMDVADLMERLRTGARLVRNPWTRLAWMESATGAQLYAAGDAIECSVSAAMELCTNPEPELLSGTLDERDLAAILALVNGGHLVLSKD